MQSFDIFVFINILIYQIHQRILHKSANLLEICQHTVTYAFVTQSELTEIDGFGHEQFTIDPHITAD